MPPHAPLTGRVGRLLGPLHVTGVFWYRAHHFAATRLPAWTCRPVIVVFTSFFFVFLFNIRRAIARNLDVVLGPAGRGARQRRIWSTMWNFAWCLTERYERLGTRRAFDMQIEGMEIWEALRASGRGFVMITAHVGNFEAGSLLPSTREARRVHVVREPETDPRAQRFVARMMRSLDEQHYEVHFQGDDPLQGMALREALLAGEIVALQGDRPRTGARNIETRFFGRPFAIAAGPAALARSAGVPILPAFTFREGRRRYRVVFRPPIDTAAASLQDLGQRIAAEVEWAVRERPHQWFCFRSVFEGRGAEGPVRARPRAPRTKTPEGTC